VYEYRNIVFSDIIGVFKLFIGNILVAQFYFAGGSQ